MRTHLANKQKILILSETANFQRSVPSMLMPLIISTIQPILTLNILSPCQFYGGFRACTLPKCNFKGTGVTLLLLQQLFVNHTHRYAIPRLDTAQIKLKTAPFSTNLAQDNPNKKKVRLQVFCNGSMTSSSMAQSIAKGMQPAVLRLQRTPHIPAALEKYHQSRIFVSLKDFQCLPRLTCLTLCSTSTCCC